MKRGTCSNCKREMGIVARGLCWKCYQAARHIPDDLPDGGWAGTAHQTPAASPPPPASPPPAKARMTLAVHQLVSLAIGMGDLAEDAVAAGEAVMDGVKPLRLRYIALKKRSDALAAASASMQADGGEEG